MLDKLVIADNARQHLLALQTDPPQGLLMTGPAGIGKLTVAQAWATPLVSAGSLTVFTPDDKGTIAIDTIRSLYQLTRNRRADRQVVILDNAQTMSLEAQNAFLKLLEEPGSHVNFVLTAPSNDSLLGTITSRLQHINLPRVSTDDLQALAKKQATVNQKELTQALFIADGRPGILVQLLNDSVFFEAHKRLMEHAKLALTAPLYERLAMINEACKDRNEAIALLEAISSILHNQLLKQPAERWAVAAEQLEICLTRLAHNGSPRAQLSAFFMSY